MSEQGAELTFEQNLDLLIEMFTNKDFDWEEHYEDGLIEPDEILRSVAKPDSIETPWPKPLAEVGSVKAEDTARGLYRLLFLFQPKGVDFDDMYKSGLFAILSADDRYAVTVELYKYELGLYFFAPPESVPPKPVAGGFDITSGIPGSDNGWHTTDPLALKFFKVITLAANREWDVYNGNNFSV